MGDSPEFTVTASNNILEGYNLTFCVKCAVKPNQISPDLPEIYPEN